MGLQLNAGFLQISNDFCCLNALKSAQTWILVSGGAPPSPASLNSDGYPISISNGGVYTVFFVAPQSDRPGNYIIRWTGGGTIYLGMQNTLISGSFTNLVTGVWNGSNGFCQISTTDTRVVFKIIAIDAAHPITNAQFAHQYDDPLITAGLAFSPYLAQVLNGSGLAKIQALGLASAQYSTTQTWTQALTAVAPIGITVLRDLGLCQRAGPNTSKWADRMPTNYYSWQSDELRSSIFAGATGGTGSAFTATLSGFTLTQGKSIIVNFSANGSVDGSNNLTCTLNVNGLGAVPIALPNTDPQAYGVLAPTIGHYGTLTYDSDLNKFLLFGGSPNSGDIFLRNGMPCERFIELCAFCGVDPWIVQPYLSSVPASDFMGSYAAYIKANYPSMHPRFELVSNENWNYAQAYPGTRYGWAKAFARWGAAAGTSDSNDYQGLGISLNAPPIRAVYAKTECEIICGVQTVTTPSNNTPRMESTLYVAEAPAMNHPASFYVTQVCFANYWHAVIADPTIISLAWQYSLTPTAAILNQMLPDGATQSMLNNAYGWLNWAAGYGAKASCYEGGYDAGTWQLGDLTADLSVTITGITAAASAVITFSDTKQPAVGSSLTISGVVGMTQINGLTGTVTASTATTATVNINSSAFTAYTSGGTMTLTGSMTYINALYAAVWASTRLSDQELNANQRLIAMGVKEPSLLALSDSYSTWAKFKPNIYHPGGCANSYDRLKNNAPLQLTVKLV